MGHGHEHAMHGADGGAGHPHAAAAHPADHRHGLWHENRAVSRQRLLISMALTGSMMVVELVGGIMAGSLALVSDAGHMFTHFFALGITYFAIRIASLPVAPEKSFGWFRAEILAALVNGLFLGLVTLVIAYEAVVRFFRPVEIAGAEMLVVAVLGLAVNVASAGLLWGASRGDLNVRSAFFHMLGDMLSSVGVVAGAGAIMLTGQVWVDPLLSLVIALVIGIWSYRLLAQSVRILMESVPQGLDLADLARSLCEADPAVRNVHDLHVWEITGDMRAMTAIAVVDPATPVGETSRIMGRMREVARQRFAIGHAIIQVEPPAHQEAAKPDR
jgi:cobalt-zinc-cadmium efflux system protein